MTSALNPYIGLMSSHQGNSNSRRPWESNIVYRPRGLTNNGPYNRPWNNAGRSSSSEESDENKPCVGLCYTMKLLKMAEEKAQEEAIAEQARRKRFDGYLYDFY